MPTRSEPASPRKLKRARGLGDFPTSPQLAQALTLGVGLCVLPGLTRALWQQSAKRLRSAATASDFTMASLSAASREALHQLVAWCLPLIAAVTITAFLSAIIEARGATATSNTQSHSRGYRIGWGHIFSWRTALTLASSLILGAIIATCSLLWFRQHAMQIASTLGAVRTGLQLLASAAMQLAWSAFFAWAAVGLTAFAIAHLLWLRQHRMSHEEQRLERKETEGDPSILSERSKARQRLLAEASAWSVSEATLVIHSAGRLAIVLRYNPTEGNAPRLLTVGTAQLARAIIFEAQRYAIPVVERPELALALAQGGFGDPIAVKHYAAVAELISTTLVR
jgi:flagellar biosynthesis protein FlhB